MRKPLLALPAFALLAVAGCASGSATTPAGHTSASASTSATASPSASASPTVNGSSLDTNNTAGWFTKTSTGTFTRVAGMFRLTAGEFATHGALGLQLCNSHTGYAIQFGAVPQSGGWVIGYFVGKLSASTGIGGDPCVGNQFLRASTVITVRSVPADSIIHAQVTEQANGDLTLTYAYSDLASFTSRVAASPGKFDEASAGASYPGITFRGPAASQATSFTDVTATASGVTGGFATWQAALVSSSKTGKPPIALTASKIDPAIGRAPSSFAILAATPNL